MVCISLYTGACILQACLIGLAILGLAHPDSEVAAGGNYNLQFLSAQARRGLSPSSRSSEVPLLGNQSIPSHAIIPYVPVSLYLEEAGFLWHDDSVWLPHLGVFGAEWELRGSEPARNTDRGSVEAQNRADASHRAYLADPIAKRHPWAFEQDLYFDGEQPTDESIISYLWPGEFVFVRSRVTGEYLTSGSHKSIVDEELNIETGTDGFARFRIGWVDLQHDFISDRLT